MTLPNEKNIRALASTMPIIMNIFLLSNQISAARKLCRFPIDCAMMRRGMEFQRCIVRSSPDEELTHGARPPGLRVRSPSKSEAA